MRGDLEEGVWCEDFRRVTRGASSPVPEDAQSNLCSRAGPAQRWALVPAAEPGADTGSSRSLCTPFGLLALPPPEWPELPPPWERHTAMAMGPHCL